MRLNGPFLTIFARSLVLFLSFIYLIFPSPTALLLLLPCSYPAPALVFLSLLHCSFPALAPAHAPALTPASDLLLPCSFPYSCSVPAYLLLPYSCPVPISALLLPCPASALPGPALGPALLLPCSSSCPPQFGSLHHQHYLTTFFGTARAAFYGKVFTAKVCTPGNVQTSLSQVLSVVGLTGCSSYIFLTT